MTRSHGPSLSTTVKKTLLSHALVPKGALVLVAVSGGPDSMALLHVLARLAPKLDFRVTAHGVDHGLREQAAAELDGAERQARDFDIPFKRTRVRVEPGPNLQSRARSARLAALRAAAESVSAERIATGHHADDRAETFFLRLLRGSGLRGLAVLPARAGALIRPLLHVRRSAILRYVNENGLAVAHDPSNEDPRFRRTRVRRDILPALEALDPKVVDHVLGLVDELIALRAAPGKTDDAIDPRVLSALPEGAHALAGPPTRPG